MGVPLPNQTIISLYVDHILYEEFHNLLTLMKQLFFEETNVEVKMHVLDKVHQYYKQNEINRAQVEECLLDVFKTVFKIQP